MKKGVGKKITFLLTLKFMVYSVRKKDVLKGCVSIVNFEQIIAGWEDSEDVKSSREMYDKLYFETDKKKTMRLLLCNS